MFTLDQIAALHAKVKSGADFPAYVRSLKAIGLSHYDLFVEDGHAVYYGPDYFECLSKAKYNPKIISDTASAEKLKQSLSIHQRGQTDFLTFCEEAAAAGVNKWTTHVINLEVIYFDKQGDELLKEPIPQV